MEDSFNISSKELTDLLNVKADQYNSPSFFTNDPISLPKQFTERKDIEIIGFIVALISWGKRESIIKNGERLVELMAHSPYEYVREYEEGMLDGKTFVHRTFNLTDLDFVIRALKSCYSQHETLEDWFYLKDGQTGIKERIINFRNEFLKTPHLQRSEKHIANPAKGSAAKRINMFLRWMVRKDEKGVDFGIWNTISMHELAIPLDVHTGNVARTLGLVTRKQNDWKTLEEIMFKLRNINPNDPCKYDYALFGMGVSGEIKAIEFILDQ